MQTELEKHLIDSLKNLEIRYEEREKQLQQQLQELQGQLLALEKQYKDSMGAFQKLTNRYSDLEPLILKLANS